MATTKTTTKTAGKGPQADATSTENTSGKAPAEFDPKTHKAQQIAARAVRDGGQAEDETEFTVLPGKSVIKGGVRYMEGEKVGLNKLDAERLVAKMQVAAQAKAGKALTAKQQEAADKAEKEAADAEAQRVADEEEAARKAAEAEARGLDPAAANK